MTVEKAIGVLTDHKEDMIETIAFHKGEDREWKTPQVLSERIEAINVALKALQPWRRALDRLPTRNDGPLVLIRQRGSFFNEGNQDWDTSLKWWDEVVRACSPDKQSIALPKDWWWSPIAKLPEVEATP